MFAIPKVADYGEVWKAFQSHDRRWSSLALVGAMIFNLFTYWWANMAALPGLAAVAGRRADADDDLGREHPARAAARSPWA